MKTVGDVNKYVSDTAPWKLKEDPDRLATVLHTVTQAVSDCNTLLAPFLPHSAQSVHEVFGGTGRVTPLPRIDEVTDLDDDSRHYPVITGEYTGGDLLAWAPRPVVPGTPVEKPVPVFTKLDDSIVEDELERLRSGADSGSGAGSGAGA
jgi:methionyl-tRNA synthetase